MNIAVVIPCFKRTDTINELYQSLLNSNYLGDKVDLVFSIDFSGIDSVELLINSFEWPYGNKKVFTHKKNIGLRNNILFCGDLTNEYDAVVILEDDLEVAPSFYKYAKQAAMFYKEDNRIAGISIYAYHLEELTFTEFHPLFEGFDNYFIQWASSWGQLWTKSQWKGFKNWYVKHSDLSQIDIPLRVRTWKNSWKKYYISYLVDTNKYFVFPFLSHVYNGTKKGGIHTDELQGEVLTSSPLDYSCRDYKFAKLDEVKYKYDVFFQLFPQKVNVKGKTYLCDFDLFGHKEYVYSPFVITSRNFKSNIIYSFNSGKLPLEINIFTCTEGHVFNLIDAKNFNVKAKIPLKSYPCIRRRTINWRQLIPLGVYDLFNSLKKKIKK